VRIRAPLDFRVPFIIQELLMPVVAVINRKGGSGKSTISTHLASWCANNSISVMLGDIDRQQSTRTWLRLRDPGFPPIAPWAMDNRNMLKPPTGVTHVVLDTPGGLHGLELARVVMFTDVILMPVCDSVFDRESAAACFAELKNLPRIASGRCKVGVIAMRMENFDASLRNLRAWAQTQGDLPIIGALHDSRVYVRCAEAGLTIFDLPYADVVQDLAQWQPVLDWLTPLLLPKPAALKPLQSVSITASATAFDASASLTTATSAQAFLAPAPLSKPTLGGAPPNAPPRPSVLERPAAALTSNGTLPNLPPGTLLKANAFIPRFLQKPPASNA
jgi:chromosome partitioning protein